MLDRGIRLPALRGELYAQLVKQLSGNSSTESQTKLWQLLHLMLTHFPPAPEFENYLEAFLRAQGPAHHNAVQMLHEIQFRGPKAAAPSPEELQQLAQRDWGQVRQTVVRVTLTQRRTSVGALDRIAQQQQQGYDQYQQAYQQYDQQAYQGYDQGGYDQGYGQGY